MDILETENAALAAELKAIKARFAGAAKGEEQKLATQFNARVAHLEERLGIKAPNPPQTPAPTEPPAAG